MDSLVAKEIQVLIDRELTELRERVAAKNAIIIKFVHYFEREELITPADIVAAKVEALQ